MQSILRRERGSGQRTWRPLLFARLLLDLGGTAAAQWQRMVCWQALRRRTTITRMRGTGCFVIANFSIWRFSAGMRSKIKCIQFKLIPQIAQAIVDCSACLPKFDESFEHSFVPIFYFGFFEDTLVALTPIFHVFIFDSGQIYARGAVLAPRTTQAAIAGSSSSSSSVEGVGDLAVWGGEAKDSCSAQFKETWAMTGNGRMPVCVSGE